MIEFLIDSLNQIEEVIAPFETLKTLVIWILMIGGFLLGCYKIFNKYFRKKRYTDKLSDDIQYKLNKYSQECATKLARTQPNNSWIENDYAKIIGFSNDFPKIKLGGEYFLAADGGTLTTELVKEIEKVTNDKRERLKNNETFGILSSSVLEASLEEISVKTADYAYISTIRDFIKNRGVSVNHAPQSITAGSLVVCPKARVIVVQLRDDGCHTHGGMYHTLGGSYQAPQKLNADEYDISRDRNNLRYTMIREVFEESRIILDNCKVSDVLFMLKQIGDGYIQYYPLYSIITEEELSAVEGIKEGDTVKIGFDDLESSLMNHNWVHSGKLHILMWLAFGAPGTSFLTRFNGLTPEKLFNKVINETESN